MGQNAFLLKWWDNFLVIVLAPLWKLGLCRRAIFYNFSRIVEEWFSSNSLPRQFVEHSLQCLPLSVQSFLYRRGSGGPGPNQTKNIRCIWTEWANMYIKFRTTKCRTVDISEFRNFEYKNNEIQIIRFFYFCIVFHFYIFFKFYKHSKYIYDK